MKTKHQIICLICFAMAVAITRAQTAAPASGGSAAPPSAPAQPSEADLEKLVAPIALYPDPLLATLLPASAYPLDIVKAARFIKDTNNIPNIDSQPWDSNVKVLAHFPEVIEKMNDDIDWTSSLGEAFANDQKSVMNAIQVLRGKAQQVGSLKTTPQQIVTVTNTIVQQTVNQQVVVVTNTIVQILPASPQVIYVPVYNPAVVYVGPPPGAVAAASFISFGMGMAMGAIIANNCNWHSGGVYVGPHGGVVWGGGYHGGSINVNRNVNINVNNNNFNNNHPGNNNANHPGNIGGEQRWQPDANHHTPTSNASPESRGWGGGDSAGGRSAFDNSGGASQSRGASQRGATSRGGGHLGGGRLGGGGGGLRRR